MPVIHTQISPMEIGNCPDWRQVTSAGIFTVPREGGRFDCHYHDCDEYWLVFAGKAKVMSEDLEYYAISS